MHLVLSIYLCEFIIFVLETAAYLVMFFTYSLRPKINAILGFKFCPTENASLTN
jgi:hypothetical protein